MTNHLKRLELDFSSFPSVIKDMIEENANAAAIIDELIELKGEAHSLTALILLDDMNIRGVQLYNLYKMCHSSINNLYDKILTMTEDDIDNLNKLSASLCGYKAILNGTSKDRKNNPNKYIFEEDEREKLITSKENTVEKDLYPTIPIKKALNIIKEEGFKCGYEKEYTVNHRKETYRVFYNEVGDILHSVSLENKDIFLWENAEINVILPNAKTSFVIDLKDKPFKTYNEIKLTKVNEIDYSLLPIIKSVKSLKYTKNHHNFSDLITAQIYDLLTFEQTYSQFDTGLKQIYKQVLENSVPKAYDKIINHLLSDDGIKIATDLQNILGYSLSKTKLLAAKERFCQAHGHKLKENRQKFLSALMDDDPYTKDMNHRIIEVLRKDIETV